MQADAAATTAWISTALGPGVGRDWSARAGQLEWTIDFTIEHITAALSKYILYLASQSPEFIAVRATSWPEASEEERLSAIAALGRGLHNTASTTPAEARAFHASGFFDAEGYEALGCLEALVHGYDVATGLGLDFEPPETLVRPTVARLLPWLEPTWAALLKHSRLENSDDSWRILTVPLVEWDGSIPSIDG